MIYTNSWLVNKYQSNQNIDFLFFDPNITGSDSEITKNCFSQWYYAPFEADGITYKTAEHWMMVSKARLFNDVEIINKILETVTPEKVKESGRLIKGFDPVIWDKYKFEIVVEGNLKKFSKHQSLKQFLLNTEKSVLAEASTSDIVWGIGMDENNPGINNPTLWKGENLLGYALMEVRDKLHKNENRNFKRRYYCNEG